jgi:ParB/Sulfiredoxin domain
MATPPSDCNPEAEAGASIRDTSRYQLMPAMSLAEFEALKADIAERGVVVPIDVDETGEILDGHHRYRAWAELKKNEPPPTIVREGLSEREKRAFARKNNILRRHLTREQVRQLIAEQLKDSPDWADNRVADELGVDGKTVGSVREDLESTSEIPKLDRLVGKDGKSRPRRQPRKRPVDPVEDIEGDDLDEDELRETDPGRAFTKAMRAWAESLGQLGDVNDLSDEEKLQLFAAGVSAGSVVVFKGSSPKAAAWERMEEEAPEQIAIHERCADFMAGPGGMAELAKTDPERAEGIALTHQWMVGQGWTVEAWFGEEGERLRAKYTWTDPRSGKVESWGKPRTKKEEKARRDMLRRMIDAGVFGPPVLDGRSHEW